MERIGGRKLAFSTVSENIKVLPILQIPNEYRKVFQGSESTDMLEIVQVSG